MTEQPHTPPDRLYAPFSDELVTKLNEFQQLGFTHPFTCGNEHSGDRVLVATNDGWKCPNCSYSQNWAHLFMGDPDSLKRDFDAMVEESNIPFKRPE